MSRTGILLACLMFIIVFGSVPAVSFAVKSGDILTWNGGGAGQVVFEGEEHAEKGYACKDCHPGLFEMKKGSARITMESLNKGRYCGACHNGTVTFSTNDPGKCHECHEQKEKHHKKKHSDTRKND